MTSEQMLKTKLPLGKIFKNVAKIGSKPNWKISLANGSFVDKTERFNNADPDCCWCHGKGWNDEKGNDIYKEMEQRE